MGEYDDILHLPRHVSSRHPHMKNADRAKQFMPFAALKGYDEAIQDKQTLYEPRLEPSDDDRRAMDKKLYRIDELLRQGEHPALTLEYFVPREPEAFPDAPALGQYREVTGRVDKLSFDRRVLQLDGREFPFQAITALWDPRPEESIFAGPDG